MSLRLWHRLLLAFVVLGIAALATFALLQERSFQRGFLDYVNRLEREKIDTGAGHLARAFARHGDWGFLIGDTPRLMRLLELGPGERMGERPGRPPGEGPRPPRPGPRDFPDGPPRDLAPGPDGPPPFAADGRPPRPPRPGLGVNLRPRLLLLDADGRVVAGNPQVPRNAPAVDVVSDGVVVGRLLVAPLPRLREDIDLEFAREQRRHMLWIAAAVLLVCLPLSWLLSRWLLRPVRALADGTRALAAGDYAARIRIDRDDELGALGRDFNALAAALEKHRDARRQWGADIAHELRTPISVLAGEIQALQDGVRTVDAERLASLQAECQRLRALVDDLYQLALSDAGALSYRFEPVDLAQLIREAARTHAGVMRDAGLTLIENAVPATATMARGDAARLRQLLDNLLGNALRYTDRPGQVVMALDPVPNGWRLRIDDSAPGVSDEALPHLFERLYRAEPSRSRRHGGAGLGLSICRNIVEAHGGTITAAHSPEGGLRIELVLPDR